jgi:hypothetical protein
MKDLKICCVFALLFPLVLGQSAFVNNLPGPLLQDVEIRTIAVL